MGIEVQERQRLQQPPMMQIFVHGNFADFNFRPPDNVQTVAVALKDANRGMCSVFTYRRDPNGWKHPHWDQEKNRDAEGWPSVTGSFYIHASAFGNGAKSVRVTNLDTKEELGTYPIVQ